MGGVDTDSGKTNAIYYYNTFPGIELEEDTLQAMNRLINCTIMYFFFFFDFRYSGFQ